MIIFKIIMISTILFSRPVFSAVQARPSPDFDMVIQKGHSGWIQSVTFSPDGELIASASSDKTIKIWTADGELIKTIDGTHINPFVSFSPDGKYLIGNVGDGIQIFNKDGTQRQLISTAMSAMQPVIRSDSKYIASGAVPNMLVIWNLDGTAAAILKHSAEVTGGAFSPDGRLIATWSKGATTGLISIWDMRGKLINSFDTGIRSIHATIAATIMLFSPKGDRIVSLCRDGFNSGSVHIWSLKGDLIETLEGEAENISFSPDGKYLAVSAALGGQIRIYGPDWKMINSFKIEGGGAFFTPDSKHIASGSGSSTPKRSVNNVNLWTLDGKLLKTFGQYFPGILEIALSPEGKHILAGYKDGTVKLWGIDGKLLRDYGIITGYYSSLKIAFGPNGRFALSEHAGGGNPRIEIKDITGTSVSTFSVTNSWAVDSISFSPDGEYLALGTRDRERNQTVKQYTTMGTLVNDLTGHAKFGGGDPGRPLNNFILGISFSSDGKHIASAGWDGIMLWDRIAGSGKRIASGRVESVSFSPDSKFIISSELPEEGNYKSNDLKLRDIAGNLVREFKNSHGNHHAHFSQSGKNIVSIGYEGIQLWDLRGNLIKALSGHDFPTDALYTTDGRNIVSSSLDGTIRVWNAETGDSFSSVAADNGAEWVSYTSDGYFDASRNGGKLVAMAKGRVSYGVDQFAARNNRPDLILERAGVATLEQISHYYLQYQKRLKKMGLTEAALNTELHIPEAEITGTKADGKFTTVSFSLLDNKYPLKRYNIYVNDTPIFGPYGREVTGNRFAGTKKLELTSGRNKIEISAVNEAGAESYRALTYADYNDNVNGDLYYLAFGVSKYKNSSLDLNYADKDVLDLQAAFLKMSSAYTNVHIKTLLNKDATAENIKKAKDFLKTARVDDTVILFLAGHGGYDKGKDPKYYYLPYEADPNDPAASGVDFESIEDILTNIQPRKKLFLMDTCESGELEEDVYARYYTTAEARGFNPRTFRKPLKTRGQGERKGREYLYEKDRFIYNNLARRSGAVVFSSSRGNEVSYESSLIQNGFFSREIINALSRNATDKNHDGKIDIEELREYVSGAVSRDTAGLQNPTIDRDNVFQKIYFPILTTQQKQKGWSLFQVIVGIWRLFGRRPLLFVRRNSPGEERGR